MKYFKYSFILLLSALLFVACEDDDEQEPATDPSFTFTVNGKEDLHSGNHHADESIEFELFITPKEGLKTITIEENGEEYLSVEDSNSSFVFVYTVDKDAQALDEIELVMIVSDENEETSDASSSYLITVNRSANPVIKHSDITLGAQHNNSEFPLIKFSEGETFSLLQGDHNPSNIDAAYMFYKDDFSVIGSPASNFTEEVFLLQEIRKWSSVNGTRFKNTSITSSEFDSIDHDIKVLSAWQDYNFKDEREVTKLSESDVVSFRTVNGKLGLFRVNNLQPGEGGYINISVVLQE